MNQSTQKGRREWEDEVARGGKIKKIEASTKNIIVKSILGDGGIFRRSILLHD